MARGDRGPVLHLRTTCLRPAVGFVVAGALVVGLAVVVVGFVVALAVVFGAAVGLAVGR